MKTLSAVLLLIFSMFSLHLDDEESVKNAGTRQIQWERVRQLDWNDFKGKPERRSDYSAVTHSVINYGYEARLQGGDPSVTLNIEVNCYFDPALSWVKKGHKTDELLAHEQLHFDISELYARKLRQRLKEYLQNVKGNSRYKKDTEQIFNDILQEWSEVQDAYDVETDHGQMKKAQQQWLEQIEQKLEQMKDYRKGRVVLSNA